MQFYYDVMKRSMVNTGVDLNENDKTVMLSTCSYEYEGFRTVIVARKVRDGEGDRGHLKNHGERKRVVPGHLVSLRQKRRTTGPTTLRTLCKTAWWIGTTGNLSQRLKAETENEKRPPHLRKNRSGRAFWYVIFFFVLQSADGVENRDNHNTDIPQRWLPTCSQDRTR